MPNSYFRFKQFTIHHDRCAMKVTTDACICGAWFAAKNLQADRILDIGAGSGLLSLMLAQKNTAVFHAIEKEAGSFEQLQQNIQESPWHDRITAFQGDAIGFEYPNRYDFIITNPPFYENELKSPDDKKNMAMHDRSLTLAILIDIIHNQLTGHGSFGILLPYYRKDYFVQLAEKMSFALIDSLNIRQTPTHPYFRCLLHFSRKKETKREPTELIIKNNSQQYTPEFVKLLKDYYLIF